MNPYLEHANLHVSNLDRMLEFLTAALPGFRVRHDSGRDDPERWVHFGDDHSYLAVYQASKPGIEDAAPYSGRPQVNHLGLVVADAALVRERLLAAGFRETTIPNHHQARKRIYFADPDGNDWEFVQYLTGDVVARNDYTDQLNSMADGLLSR